MQHKPEACTSDLGEAVTVVTLLMISGVFMGDIRRCPPKDFLTPKCHLKRRLTWYYCYLILTEITKFVSIKCQILRLKCTKFNFGWGSTPDPAGGAYSTPPDPLAGFKGTYF